MTDVDELLKKIICENCGLNILPEAIRDDMNIYQDFAMDSIKIVNTVSDIEMLFDISIALDSDLIEALKEYQKLKIYVESKVKERT